MKIRSRKNKGLRLQNEIKENFKNLAKDLNLNAEDIQSSLMSQSGKDIIFYGDCSKIFNFSIECKNVEKLNIWNAIKQAEQNKENNEIPIVFIKRNFSDIYAVIPKNYFFELLKNNLQK